MSNVRIDIAAVWKGTQAFNKAFKATKKLDTSVTNLAKSFATVFAAQKVYSFGKNMANAFMEDQKSAAILSNTVKNLGLSFADLNIKSFIDQLSLTAGVIDDELRPAMQKLLTTTGSVAKSQDLLKTAIDVSRATGVDLQTVTTDIANAYVGNNRGLKKYTLGLSAAELKTASFDKVLQAFNRNFSGANAAYLKTYAGQLTAITVAADSAKESIGKGIIDGFKILAGDTTLDDLSGKIARLGDNIGNFFRGLAQGFKDLANMPIIHQLVQLAEIMLKLVGKAAGGLIDPFVLAGARSQSSKLAPASMNSHLAELSAASNAAAQKKAEQAATKRAKELAAAQNKNTQALKDQAKLKKQSALFDMEQIQLIAALQGKISEEDRKRVLLQLALLQGNEEAAAKLSQEVANAIDKTGNLAKYLQTLPDANNPFKNWDAWLETFKGKLGSIGYNPLMPNFTNPPDTSNVPVPSPVTGFAIGGVKTGDGQVIKIDLNVDSKQIASVLQNASLSGNQVYVDRLSGRFYE